MQSYLFAYKQFVSLIDLKLICFVSPFLPTVVSRTTLDEGSARRRGFYLDTHTAFTTDKHPPPGGIQIRNLIERAAVDYALDRAVTGIDLI